MITVEGLRRLWGDQVYEIVQTEAVLTFGDDNVQCLLAVAVAMLFRNQ